MAHKHSFSVDTSCDCGVMLSEYTRNLAKKIGALVAALKAQAMTEYIIDGTFCWCDRPPKLSTAVHSSHCTLARAVLEETKGAPPCAQ
jgi:hypothetical protein